MTDLRIRRATPSDTDSVLRFWAEAAEGTSISDDHDGVAARHTVDFAYPLLWILDRPTLSKGVSVRPWASPPVVDTADIERSLCPCPIMGRR